MRTKQARNSDWGKQAKKTSKHEWGGRWADGLQDSIKPKSWFKYTSKKKRIYKYPTKIRKQWKSYGKKYK